MRSVLFTPGDRPDRLRTAWAAGAADVVVADLEDGVPPERKASARADVVAALAGSSSRTARAVRINTGPAGEADLEALHGAALDLVVVPKAEDPARLEAVARRLPGIGVVAIVETARGVLEAARMAAVPAVEALAFGAEDLAADAGLLRSAANTEIAVPRALVALAAAASGKAALDMITADFRDLARTAREAREARALGYAGKMCLHPDQVEAVHKALRPADDDVAWARRVVSAAEAGGAGQGGVVVVDWRMVDVPLIRQARRLLELADLP